MLRIFKVILRRRKLLAEAKAGVKSVLGIPAYDLIRYGSRIVLDTSFWRDYYGRIAEVTRASSDVDKPGGWVDSPSALLIYCLIRYFKPATVVETGVGAGGSSMFILRALQHNDHGQLFSIDLPGNDKIAYKTLEFEFDDQVPPGYETGWLVPEKLRSNWTLILGDSKVELPKLVSRLGETDMFIHDSLHTDDHIRFEFETVLPSMSGKGCIACHDVNESWSLEFTRICRESDFSYFVFNDTMGVAAGPREHRNSTGGMRMRPRRYHAELRSG